MNRRTLFLAAAAALVAFATACSDVTGPKNAMPLNPRASADSLICSISNGSQVCSPA